MVCRGARNLWVAAGELDGDGSLTKVGTHGEVGNSGDHGDGSGNIMEDAMGARLGEGKADKDEGRDGHNGSDSLRGSVSSCCEQ